MTDYNKMSWLDGKLLKMKDAEEYKNLKYVRSLNKIKEWPKMDIPNKDVYSFKHSGNAGDLVYSLATIKALSKNAFADLYLNLGQAGRYGKKPHPLGNVMLNEKMSDMLKPLLLEQPYIRSVEKFSKDIAVDYDLDEFRNFPIKLASGHIARWYFYMYGINADLGKAWLTAPPDNSMTGYIVIARSQRYRQPLINYTFLKKYSRLIFVGVEAEYKDMKQMLPGIEFVPVTDFLQLASIISGCRFFIGNQSFPFSLAEALKVRRVLEAYHLCPNVITEGETGYDFYFQQQFEKIVAHLAGETA